MRPHRISWPGSSPGHFLLTRHELWRNAIHSLLAALHPRFCCIATRIKEQAPTYGVSIRAPPTRVCIAPPLDTDQDTLARWRPVPVRLRGHRDRSPPPFPPPPIRKILSNPSITPLEHSPCTLPCTRLSLLLFGKSTHIPHNVWRQPLFFYVFSVFFFLKKRVADAIPPAKCMAHRTHNPPKI